MERNVVDQRANALFADNGVIGGPIKGIYNIGDIPNIIPHLFIARYEDIVSNPEETLNTVFNWLEVEPIEIDFNNIKQFTEESDSYYRYKYPHKIKDKLIPGKDLKDRMISPRILDTIVQKFDWFYKSYYQDVIQDLLPQEEQETSDIEETEKRISNEIDEALNNEDAK
jgi:sulfotransferase